MTEKAGSGKTAPLAKKGQIAIIGARGRMGRMLSARAETAGYNVNAIDIPFHDEQLQKGLSHVTLALLCVPVRNFRETLKTITPWLNKNAILADITSVKESPMRQMQDIWKGSVIGTHPLFGPKPNTEADLPVVLVRGKNSIQADMDFMDAFFTNLGFRTFEATAKEHDQAMAKIQNMNFITNLAYFAVLAGQEQLLPYLTPSFERRKDAAKKMLTEDSEMFSGLFEANGYSHEAVRQFRKMLNVAASGDIDLLCKKAQWWWQEETKSEEK